ncbi:MAG TPA: hypothetical protein PLM53_15485 [Spirochaetota bacterium]|nr:hypothetical protein [Spirochaetota bacterium]HPC39802.1 hypothetical protein [Spirochaetota bacterium]HPL16332.1 hypothetical protein [Spirochaetota bacterium]HQF09849.1 hypothetical protein [Spirochaetota bacterium]HQH98499.1 hypothetical protein [Spirochaetota bacterium]
MKKTLVLILTFFLTAALAGCGKKVPLPDDQKAFAGKWVADDGTFVTIYLDGGGDLKGSNTSITGGNTTITADSLTIGMGPIKKTMKITEKPKEVGGKKVLVLDGITYTKQQ